MREQDLARFEAALDEPPRGGVPSTQLAHASGAWSRDAELAQFKQASG